MKAIVIDKHGLDGLAITRREPRPPGHREVRLRLRAVSLNYRDLEIVEGRFSIAYPLPLVPLRWGR
ncbi:hypothetical protein [Bosea sp. BIWAKO-01]|uniref:hypothetical protein n=1 Tax=Bosea sp. BIWAKO-01 TaxID=506668 RepID=UPI00086A1A9B|nr:hypothetical protein [Bosea sp. BIWAKO-01]GAU80548.1 alcohol dehydrogenase [Bosea sp. BIWAKO-01]